LHTVVAKLSGAFHSHEKMKEGRTNSLGRGNRKMKETKRKIEKGDSRAGRRNVPPTPPAREQKEGTRRKNRIG
jgi:hypothetical protein